MFKIPSVITLKSLKIFKAVLIILGVFALLGLLLYRLIQFSPVFSQLPFLTKASFNHDGDPINIAILGDKDSITKAFLASHWVIPDPITKNSTRRIIETSIASKPYPTAPVSNLYLFGRTQDLTFEYPTDTVRKRHHIRLWQTDKIISGKSLWLGSATFDSNIELSHVSGFPTHHISSDIDKERDFIKNSLTNSGLIQSLSLERNAYPTFWGFNGGGDWYFDDGLVQLFVLQ